MSGLTWTDVAKWYAARHGCSHLIVTPPPKLDISGPEKTSRALQRVIPRTCPMVMMVK